MGGAPMPRAETPPLKAARLAGRVHSLEAVALRVSQGGYDEAVAQKVARDGRVDALERADEVLVGEADVHRIPSRQRGVARDVQRSVGPHVVLRMPLASLAGEPRPGVICLRLPRDVKRQL